MNDLPDTLLGEAKHLSECGYRLAFLVAGTDFSIARALGGSAIGDRKLRENQAAIRESHRERHGEKYLGE